MTWFTLSVEGWMREWMVAGPRDHKAEGCPVQTPSTGRKFAVCVVSQGEADGTPQSASAPARPYVVESSSRLDHSWRRGIWHGFCGCTPDTIFAKRQFFTLRRFSTRLR